MTSNLTRQLSIGFSSTAALQGETTLHKSWSLPFVSTERTTGRDAEALIVLLLESAEPLPMGSRLLTRVGEEVRKAFGRESLDGRAVRDRMESAIQSANDLVLREMANAAAALTQRISLLLAAFMPAGDANCGVMIGHVGACRAFLRRQQHIIPLTKPHTWGQENVESSFIPAADEENESKYASWRRPTRFLGATQTVAVDFRLETTRTDVLVDAAADRVKLQRGDSILLCSSTLTATSLEKQRDHINARSASALAQQLTDRAALPGGHGAAAVVVGWSNTLWLIPIVATGLLLALGALAVLVLLVFPSQSSPPDSTPIAQQGTGEVADIEAGPPSSSPASAPSAQLAATDPSATAVSSLSSTAIPAPPVEPPSTAADTATSMPPTRTSAPTRTALQTSRAPTATTAPTSTLPPTATSTPTAPSTLLLSPTSTPAVATPIQTQPPATEYVFGGEKDVSTAIDGPNIEYRAFAPKVVGEDNATNLLLSWSSSGTLPEPYRLEVIAWRDSEDNPDAHIDCFLNNQCGRGIAQLTKDLYVRANLELLSNQSNLRGFLTAGGRYNWSVFVVLPSNGDVPYTRIASILETSNGDYPTFEFRRPGSSVGRPNPSVPTAIPNCVPAVEGNCQ